jgi:hypothetical protein
MKPLSPHLPLQADETPVSWAWRLAAFHIGGRASAFLADNGLELRDIATGAPEAIKHLAELGGADPEHALRNAPQRISDTEDLIRHERAASGFVIRRRTLVCPCCLVEDAGRAEPDPVRLAGRYSWQFLPVISCPNHGVAFVDIAEKTPAGLSFPMAEHAIERWGHVVDAADRADHVGVSPVQTYVLSRLDGIRGPSWLDGQQIDQAAKVCEILGAMAYRGARPNSKSFTAHDWHTAHTLGFSIAAGGETAIRDLLSDLQTRCYTNNGHAGPQAMFGVLWDWLAHVDHDRDRGPIKEIVRQHIIETHPVGEGEVLLGRPVEKRRIHSVRTLAVATGLNFKRLQKFLVARGVLAPGLRDANPNRAVFDAADGEAAARILLDGLRLAQLPDYLGIKKTLAASLVSAGLVEPLVEPEAEHELNQYRFDRGHLDAFLVALFVDAATVPAAPEGFATAVAVAKSLNLKLTSVLGAVLDGRLTRRRKLQGEPGVAALLLEMAEARDVFQPDRATRDYAPYRAVDRLRTTDRVIAALMRDRPGGSILPTKIVKNCRSDTARVIPYDALEDFDRTFVSLTNLSRERGTAAPTLMKRLADMGIEPAFDPADVKARFYRRELIPPDV